MDSDDLPPLVEYPLESQQGRTVEMSQHPFPQQFEEMAMEYTFSSTRMDVTVEAKSLGPLAPVPSFQTLAASQAYIGEGQMMQETRESGGFGGRMMITDVGTRIGGGSAFSRELDDAGAGFDFGMLREFAGPGFEEMDIELAEDVDADDWEDVTESPTRDLPPAITSTFSILPPHQPRQRTRRDDKGDGHIPRPPNAFILFRSAFIRSQKISGKVEGRNSKLSKIIGMYWHALPPSEREHWEAKARMAQEEHRRRYPDWRFRLTASSSGHGRANGGGKTQGDGRERGRRGKAKPKPKPKAKPKAATRPRQLAQAVQLRDEKSGPDDDTTARPSSINQPLTAVPASGTPHPSASAKTSSSSSSPTIRSDPAHLSVTSSGSESGVGSSDSERTARRLSKIASFLVEGRVGGELEKAMEEWEVEEANSGRHVEVQSAKGKHRERMDPKGKGKQKEAYSDAEGGEGKELESPQSRQNLSRLEQWQLLQIYSSVNSALGAPQAHGGTLTDPALISSEEEDQPSGSASAYHEEPDSHWDDTDRDVTSSPEYEDDPEDPDYVDSADEAEDDDLQTVIGPKRRRTVGSRQSVKLPSSSSSSNSQRNISTPDPILGTGKNPSLGTSRRIRPLRSTTSSRITPKLGDLKYNVENFDRANSGAASHQTVPVAGVKRSHSAPASKLERNQRREPPVPTWNSPGPDSNSTAKTPSTSDGLDSQLFVPMAPGRTVYSFSIPLGRSIVNVQNRSPGSASPSESEDGNPTSSVSPTNGDSSRSPSDHATYHRADGGTTFTPAKHNSLPSPAITVAQPPIQRQQTYPGRIGQHQHASPESLDVAFPSVQVDGIPTITVPTPPNHVHGDGQPRNTHTRAQSQTLRGVYGSGSVSLSNRRSTAQGHFQAKPPLLTSSTLSNQPLPYAYRRLLPASSPSDVEPGPISFSVSSPALIPSNSPSIASSSPVSPPTTARSGSSTLLSPLETTRQMGSISLPASPIVAPESSVPMISASSRSSGRPRRSTVLGNYGNGSAASGSVLMTPTVAPTFYPSSSSLSLALGVDDNNQGSSPMDAHAIPPLPSPSIDAVYSFGPRSTWSSGSRGEQSILREAVRDNNSGRPDFTATHSTGMEIDSNPQPLPFPAALGHEVQRIYDVPTLVVQESQPQGWDYREGLSAVEKSPEHENETSLSFGGDYTQWSSVDQFMGISDPPSFTSSSFSSLKDWEGNPSSISNSQWLSAGPSYDSVPLTYQTGNTGISRSNGSPTNPGDILDNSTTHKTSAVESAWVQHPGWDRTIQPTCLQGGLGIPQSSISGDQGERSTSRGLS